MTVINNKISLLTDAVKAHVEQVRIFKPTNRDLTRVTQSSTKTVQKHLTQLILRLKNRGIHEGTFSFKRGYKHHNWTLLYINQDEVITYLTGIGAEDIHEEQIKR